MPGGSGEAVVEHKAEELRISPPAVAWPAPDHAAAAAAGPVGADEAAVELEAEELCMSPPAVAWPAAYHATAAAGWKIAAGTE